MRALLLDQRFRQFSLAKLLQLAGQNALIYGLFILVIEKQDSSLSTSLFVLGSVLPSVVLSIPGGVVADATPRKMTILLMLVARLAIILMFIRFEVSLPLVLGLTLLIWSIYQFYSPAENAALVAVTPPGMLVQANVVMYVISLLAQLGGNLTDVGLCRVVCFRATDELDERHDRHRAEEVHADERGVARGPGGFGEAMDGDRAGVRGEDRPGARDAVHLAPQGLLHVDVLEHRLDDEIGIGGGCQFVRGGQAVKGRRPVAGAQPGLVDGALEVAGDAHAAGFRPGKVGLVERDLRADRGEDLGDAMAHQAGPGDEDTIDAHGEQCRSRAVGQARPGAGATSECRRTAMTNAPAPATRADVTNAAGKPLA